MTGLFRINGKKILAAAAAVILTFSQTAGIYAGETTVITAASTGEFRTWKQFDSRWGDMHLGPSEDTMSQSGCVTTSVAILLVKEGFFDETEFNPGVFCKFAGENGGFDKNGIFYWYVVTKLVPEFTFSETVYLYGSTKEEKTAEIKRYVDAGYSVIADVNYSGHWVAVDRVENGIVYDIDPGGYRSDNMFEQYDFHGSTCLKLFKVAGRPVSEVKPSVKPQEPETVYTKGAYIITETDELNVRKGPSTSTERIGGLVKGTGVEVTEISGCWGKIDYNGSEAWICLEYGTKIEEPEPEPELPVFSTGTYRISDMLNYREQPDVSSKSYGLIDSGIKVNVYEISGVWGRTKFNGKDSWICLEYADFVSEDFIPEETKPAQTEVPQVTTVTTTIVTTTTAETTVTTTTAPVTTTKEAVHYRTTDPLNFRKGPGTDKEVITVLPEGTDVYVTEVKSGWGKINFKGTEGWICLEFANIIKDNSSQETAVLGTSASAEANSSVTERPLLTMMGPAAVITPVSTSAAEPGILRGDLDRNGYINIIDFVKMKSYFEEEEEDIPEADVNGDGVVTILDLLCLGKMFMS